MGKNKTATLHTDHEGCSKQAMTGQARAGCRAHCRQNAGKMQTQAAHCNMSLLSFAAAKQSVRACETASSLTSTCSGTLVKMPMLQ